MPTSSLQLAVWGIKQKYQVFFHSPGLAVADAAVRKGLEDVRSLVKYQSVELNYYSVAWAGGYEVYTAYTALYDWMNRKNGYVAVSVFVPAGKMIVGGPLSLLDKLLQTYRQKFVGSDYKIKQQPDQPELFFALLNEAQLMNDPRPKQAGQGLGVVRYTQDRLNGYLANPYLEVFAGYEKIYFLPEGQRRINGASKLRTITGGNGQAPVPEPRSTSVTAAPQVEETPRKKEVDSVFIAPKPPIAPATAPPSPPEVKKPKAEEKPPQAPKVPVKPKKILAPTPVNKKPAEVKQEPLRVVPKPVIPPKSEPPTIKQPPVKKAPSEVDKWFQNTSVWVNTKKWLDGPVTATFLLREAMTGGKIIPASEPAKLAVNNLGGTFYSDTDVITIEGLYPGDKLMGNVSVEGYRLTKFEFVVPEFTPTGGKLSPVEIRMPELAGRVKPMGIAAVTKEPAPKTKAVKKVEKPQKKGGAGRTWLGIGAGAVGLLLVLMIAGVGPFGDKSDATLDDFSAQQPQTIDAENAARQEEGRRNNASIAERQERTQEVIQFANAAQLFQTQEYDATLALFGSGSQLAFTTPSQRDVIRARIEAMKEVAKSDYRVRQTNSRSAGMSELKILLADDRLNDAQRTFLQQRYDGYVQADERETKKSKEEEKKKQLAARIRKEVNAAELYPLSSYREIFTKIDKNEGLSKEEKKKMRARLKVMQQVAQVKADEKKGVFPPDNPLAKLAKNSNLTSEQKAFVRKLAQ